MGIFEKYGGTGSRHGGAGRITAWGGPILMSTSLHCSFIYWKHFWKHCQKILFVPFEKKKTNVYVMKV